MLRGGLVGLGRMGLTHMAILNANPEVKWVGVCDTTPFVLKNLQQRMGFEAFSDYRKMIESGGIDFLIVATPTGFHADVIECAIENRVPLFVEKPLTLSAAVSKRLAERALAAGIVTQVGYVNRFNAMFAEARRALKAGAIGEPLYVRSEMWGRTVLKPTKSGWRSRKDAGGGCLYDFASHCVDLVHFLVGVPDAVAASALQSVFSSGVEDAVYSTFRYRSGATAQIAVNWSDESCRKPSNRIEVLGRAGKLIVQQHELHLYLKEPADGYEQGWNVRYLTDLASPVGFYLRGNEFTAQLDHFIDCVRLRRGSSVASFGDGAAVDQVLEQIAADSSARS